MKKTKTKIICLCLAAIMLCPILAGCGSSADSEFLSRVESAVTESKAILNDALSLSDEMIGRTDTVLQYSAQEEGFDSLNEYGEVCGEYYTKIDEYEGQIRKLMQDIEKLDAPTTDHGKAVYEAQAEYFSNVIDDLEEIKTTLGFYYDQHTATQPMIESLMTDAADQQEYLYNVYKATLTTVDGFSSLATPSYLSDLWPKYVKSYDIFTKYMESYSEALAYGDVLKYYSATQLVERMGIEGEKYEGMIYDLMAQQYTHCSDVIASNLLVLADEIIASCKGDTLPQDENGYMSFPQITMVYKTMAEEIYPNLYPSMDSVINLLMYNDKGYRDVTVTAEVAGFSQVYEQMVTLSPQMTYLMIKPPVLSDMPDLSTTKDTQLTLKVTDSITGEVLAQESKNIKIYSIYDYKVYSDEFGTIQNDNVLAWMTPESDGVLAVRRTAVAWLENTFGQQYSSLPGYQYSYGFGEGQESSVTLYQVAAIQSAISAMGVRYNMGAYSLNATQRVLMPDAVLESQSGICIETAILMASVLQSADMHPMIIFTPGHAQVAVETWSGSGQYFLIETTNLPFDASVDDINGLVAYYSSEDWANYLGQAQQTAQESGGMVYIVDCDLGKVLDIQGLNNYN